MELASNTGKDSFFDIKETEKNIDKAYEEVERASTLNVAKESQAMAKDFQRNVARYGGEAMDSGAYKNTIAGIFSDMNVQIANIANSFAIQKNQAKMSANMYFTDLASKGIIDPASGSFLKSTYNMQVELNEQQFRNQMGLLQEQGRIQESAQRSAERRQESASMWGGLGSLAGMMLAGPLGGYIGGQIGDQIK